MVLVFAAVSLAAALAQSPIGETFNPARRPHVTTPPSLPQVTTRAEPSLYPPAASRNPQLGPHPTDRAALLAARRAQQDADRVVCHMRVYRPDTNVDPGIAVPVPTDRDYKIVRITPPCLE
jgi:hypothetical protein